MRREHIDRLRPICPTCRAAGRPPRPLGLGTVVRTDPTDQDDLLEAVLVCPERLCQREHPIVDGIAIVVTDLQSWAAHQLDAVLRRDDLSSFTLSLLGDAAGPGSVLDRERAMLSTYGWTHWGDGAPGGPTRRQSSYVSLLEAALGLLTDPPHGVWVDLGCAVGRGTLELARRTPDLVLGVDLSFAMLRVAERVRRERRALFPVRRVGMVFDHCDVAIADVPAERMSFWCCDVGLLPFAADTFDGALSLNVVDCVASPVGHLLELERVLRPGASALLSSPYDWNPSATPVADWLGGHSQRSAEHGSSAARLRAILGGTAGLATSLTVAAEQDPVPWRVYINERASMDYALDLLRLERRP